MRMPWIEDPQRLGRIGDPMQSSMDSPDTRMARAALVASDIDGFYLDGFSVTWPDGSPLPEDFAPKSERGERMIDPHCEHEKPPPFHAIYLRRVDGRIDQAGLCASQEGFDAVDWQS
jgi:hypothetical protein